VWRVDQKIIEEGEEDDEAWINRFDNSKMINDEEREEYNRDEPSDSKGKWEKIGLKLEGYSLCAIEEEGKQRMTWKYSGMKEKVNQR
jgi:predicted 3-demethylubiquinone-9 3-methyltransferase (glyoxalase superfamily)